ncbi:hypothetical protein EV360DRAFT_73535 [Lentinula raphanica]|nr:hypothetical protein EV360DRAFT_73535 [Lentinula raphanica]
MLLSRSTSVIFLAAVGMITVLGLPVPDEHNLSPSLTATNAQAPAVQEISKRMNAAASQSGSSSTNPTAQKRPPPEAGSSERRPKVSKTAEDLPPGAYPPIFKWKGGRKFELKAYFKDKRQVGSSEQIEKEIKEEMEKKINSLRSHYYHQEKHYLDQEKHLVDEREKSENERKKHENLLFNKRVMKLESKLNGLTQKPHFVSNEDFKEKMKILNALVLLYNDDLYEKVIEQINWIRGNINGLTNSSTKESIRFKNTLDRVLKKMPNSDDMYELGLAGKDNFGYENRN